MRIGLDLTLKSALKTGPSDVIAPTLVITLSDYALKIGDTATVTFTFSEAPTGFTEADVTAPNCSLSSFGVTGNPLIYTAIFTPTADVSDATNVITVGTGWTDAAGNPPAGATTSDNYTVDTTAPTVVITSSESSPTAASPIPITVTFSESVTGFVVGDITISAGSLANFSGSGTTYTVNWTPGIIGALTMDIAGGVCVDAAGNANTAASQFAITETTITAPAITPTLGSELLVNPDFEGAYDDESGGTGTANVAPNWNKQSIETDDILDKELTIIHGGSASQKIVMLNANEGVAPAAAPMAAIGWYQASVWIYNVSGNGIWIDSDSGPSTVVISAAGVWTQAVGTGRTTGSNHKIYVLSGASTTSYIDDASVKAILLSSMLSSLGTWAGRDGTYTCHPTVATKTQAGMAVAYLNATNFVLAVVDRGSNTAKLLKLIAGTWTQIISGAVTYSAAAELKVVISGTSYSLYYNTIQVGTTQTISNTLGDGIYGFNALAGNTVGSVTANP